MNVQQAAAKEGLQYLSGFGNALASEALAGALPLGRNSPQRCPYGLYAEQLSGSPFTAPRASNLRSWLYRIRPTVAHWGQFTRVDARHWITAPAAAVEAPLGPMRWDPLPLPTQPLSFVQGVHTMTTCGDASTRVGMGAHVYLISRSMIDEYFYNADAEMLFVPQLGKLRLCTEFGIIDIEPREVAVIPRGVKLRIELCDAPARGYLCENYGRPLTLPELGPIGANGLANPRDFLTPVAAYQDHEVPSRLYVKSNGALWEAAIGQSPLDVVAWHGNYAPYKYDLRRFSPVGPVLFDHADPSIFTVLTSSSATPGTANLDFVIFPDRWLVSEDTFRPPWYHMNLMSEFMGLIAGQYDAKPTGFIPGGASLHNCMLPHGPDVDAFETASAAQLQPHKLEGTLAFMFETRLPQQVTSFAATCKALQSDYVTYGAQLHKHFNAQQP
jgi:homogentisate 1,2-dioxygenase